jgi:hypothetical protein
MLAACANQQINTITLLACIKYLGKFPCPHCLIPNHQISELGTKNDKKRWEKLARVDDEHRRDTVELARKRIYEKGTNVKSKSIKDLLGPKGWTPTRVRSSDLHETTNWSLSHPECLFRETLHARFRFSFHVCTRFTSWVWIGCLEGLFRSLNAVIVCTRWGFYHTLKLMVNSTFFECLIWLMFAW